MSRATLNRYAARRDANEPDIVRALVAAGASVTRMKEPVDLLVGFRGVTYLMDVKVRGKGQPTDKQIEFMENWTGGPAGYVHDVDEALRFIGAIE